MKLTANRKFRFALGLSSLTAMAIASVLWQRHETQFPAMNLLSPTKKSLPSGELSPDKVATLLAESTIQPLSSRTNPVEEPPLPDGITPPLDLDALGYGSSKFIANTKWATIRFVGDNPAGAGLTGAELNRAQIDALGTRRDTVPVVTTAQTIDEMMEQYFVPLLKTLPRGEDILSKIKIQGAYFAPGNESITERDNAFVVGVQSLYIYSNSCFDKTSANSCSPLGFSAGHDPTIIGHELAHAIFNHIRDERSLEGWQWFAVNEGYADFLSASYFGDPVLGRIWRVSRPSGARYLRRLLDTPTTNDPKALEEGHAFGSVWSSALWRSRNRIVSTFKVKPFDFDRVVLMSINFLGETTKTKLGDAASAVLKATDVLGYSDWKDVLLEEFKKGEVELARGVKLSTATGEVVEVQQGGIKCGQVSAHLQASSKGQTERRSALAILLLPGLLLLGRLKRRKVASTAILVTFSGWIQGCQLSSLWKNPETKPGGLAIVYLCNMNTLKDGTPILPLQRTISFTFTDSTPTDSKTEQIFAGDERFENAESSLLLLVDKSSMRIDQFRRRDGSLFQLNLGQKYFSTEDALAVQNMRLSSIIIEGAGRAWRKENDQSQTTPSAATKTAINFDVTGSPATATIKPEITGARGFGPLPEEINLDGQPLCRYQKTTR